MFIEMMFLLGTAEVTEQAILQTTKPAFLRIYRRVIGLNKLILNNKDFVSM
jgi:hypothetical protein